MDPALWERSPNGHTFVRATHCLGILPRVLGHLLGSRSVAKNNMAAAKDAGSLDLAAIYDAQVGGGVDHRVVRVTPVSPQQLAFKVSANSVYGFTGATIGSLPCVPISESVTAYGRKAIELAKETVEAYYTEARICEILGVSPGVVAQPTGGGGHKRKDITSFFQVVGKPLPPPPPPTQPPGARCIYGDTDSIMIVWGPRYISSLRTHILIPPFTA